MTRTRRSLGVVFALACTSACLTPTPLPAAAIPPMAFFAAPSGVLRAMMVCSADGCRHRFKAYRARPAWSAYMMREHPPEPAPAPAPTTTEPGAARRGEHRR